MPAQFLWLAQVTQLGGWRIKMWTGRVDGQRLAWVGGRQPQLSGEAEADRVLILLPPAATNPCESMIEIVRSPSAT